MELQTKFIEGTNEQYSIREDGVVISHYRLRHTPLNDMYFMIFKNKELKLLKDTRVNITIKNVRKSVSVKKLLFEYFKYSVCKECDTKVEKYLKKNICKTCIRLKRNKYTKEKNYADPEIFKEKRKIWRNNNVEGYRSMAEKASEKAKINLTRSYIAHTLNLSVKDLPDDLYCHHRKLILFKRQIAEEQKINIEKLV